MADTQKDIEQSKSPSSTSMAILVSLGALSALWALFLWAELVVARSGGTAFCAVSETIDCATLWDGTFASSVHKYTRMPIAGWGLVWGLLATGFPLLALLNKSESKDTNAATSATRLTALVGVVTTVLLILVAISAKTLCIGCIGTYVLVALYGGVALYGWRSFGFKGANQAAVHMAFATIAGFALLLYPGIKTPKNAAKAGADAIANAGKSAPASSHTGHNHEPTKTTTNKASDVKTPPEFAKGKGTGDPQLDMQIEQFILSLPPQLQQQISDSLYAYNHATPIETEKARAIHGNADATIKIVDWTDPLCGHCAQLHDVLDQIEKAVPPGSFSLESRYYPLDATCNPSVPRKGDGLRCTIVGAQLCMENDKNAHDFSKFIFGNQRGMSAELLFETARRYTDVDKLKKCINSKETQDKLTADLKYAAKLNPDGTPIVLLNGKKSSSVGPYLYLMMLTKGVAEHPAFKHLPQPNKDAHLH